ncbi:unnamed protein product [Schistosoma curassoni]|uniref:Reverse transcriptase domain-containing protein n=1 Tax=Schistosoma curassoni TaxID=6186 RepID=A0A183JJ38_9TREM|nr:unnamed protein product [Schistosoma curassoni]
MESSSPKEERKTKEHITPRNGNRHEKNEQELDGTRKEGPGQSLGVVLMNKAGYITMMKSILDDQLRFKAYPSNDQITVSLSCTLDSRKPRADPSEISNIYVKRFIPADRQNRVNVADKFMVYFDVTSFFARTPLFETIDIICQNYDLPPLLATEFKKLILMCTTDVQFQFNNTKYRQIDGVAMGSPLGPIMADIVMGYLESD